MGRFCKYGVALLLLLQCLFAAAQSGGWNDALDRYDQICRRCAQWRTRLSQGESVPKDSLSTMLRELSDLKTQLQGTLGEMTPGQRRRFEAIRDAYAGIEAEPDPGILGEVSLQADASSGTPAIPSPPAASAPARRHHWMAGAVAGVIPDRSYGILAGYGYGCIGFFVKARSNFRTRAFAYDCRSDGTTEDGYVWTDGSTSLSRHQITLDLFYTPWKPLSLYLGGGYGARTLCWRDTSGQWARVSDRSFRGFALDFGVLVRPVPKKGWDSLTLLLGGSWIPARYVDGEIGIAWNF